MQQEFTFPDETSTPPLCACGCGFPVTKTFKGKWNRYIAGHGHQVISTTPIPEKAPLCACGCGNSVALSRFGKWNEYIRFHHIVRPEPFEPDAPAPLCACGCGQSVECWYRNGKRRGWNRYVRLHHANGAPEERRFWRYVQKSDGCWEWQGRRCPSGGYGQLTYGGRVGRAHRYSWELHFGPIPEGKIVCHHCDNPPCVRPDHLFLGTHLDNAHDRIAKGRSNYVRGERIGCSKLTSAKVVEIRALRATGRYKLRDLARLFNMSYTTIQGICAGTHWTHLL